MDALYRGHAEVEDRVKGIKRVGLGPLPSKSWQMNAAWVPAATIAAGLDAHAPRRTSTLAWPGLAWPWAAASATAWRRARQLPART